MARPKLGETETERMQLKITTAEIQAIDDWRFANRIPSRSEAVRRLCQVGLVVGSHLEDLADVAHLSSDAVSGLEDDAFSFWRTIASPTYESPTLRREAVIEVVGEFMEQLSAISSGVEHVSSVLVGLFSAAVGIAHSESGDTTERAKEALKESSDVLKRLQEARAQIDFHRKEMAKYSFKEKTEGDEL